MSEPKWLELARTELGQHEINGPKSNPEIIKFFNDAGHPEIHSEATAWCAAFVGAMLRRAGEEPTGSLLARSYLTWGTALQKIEIGAIAVLWRGSPDSSEGHVGFVVDAGADFVKILGGNQGSLGQVSIETFPMSRVLSFRWPSDPKNTEANSPPSKPFKPIAEAAKSRSIGDRIMTDVATLEALIPTIELYAPTVGQLLGGPVGGIGGQLAAVGIHALASAFGVEPTTEAVVSHMTTQPFQKVSGGLLDAEELAAGSLPQPQTSAPAEPPVTIQDEVKHVFTDAGVTNPTIVMIGSFVTVALSGWLINKGWVSNDVVLSTLGAIPGLIAAASSVYHSFTSNRNTAALAASK
jgi:uncharacterized protein (TIGR02594 family)